MKPRLKDLQVKAKKVGIRPMRKDRGIRICVIPDTQDKPGAPQDHFTWLGRWIADRKPQVVVHLGDFVDMGSCSTHDDPGSLESEGRSIAGDLAHGRESLALLNRAMGKWRGRKVLTLGNHENRLLRYVNAHPEHRDTYAHDPFGFEAAGWEVHGFLKPVVIAGIAFVHFVPRSASGKVTQTRNGAPSALAQLRREMRSIVTGHTQGLDVACLTVGDRTLRSVQAGSCYLHTEDYLSPQGQGHWAGALELNEAADGYADPCEVSLEYLCRKYGGGRWPKEAKFIAPPVTSFHACAGWTKRASSGGSGV